MFSTEGIDDIFRLSLHRAFALAYFGPRCTQVIILSHAKRIGKSAIGQSHAIDLCTFQNLYALPGSYKCSVLFTQKFQVFQVLLVVQFLILLTFQTGFVKKIFHQTEIFVLKTCSQVLRLLLDNCLLQNSCQEFAGVLPTEPATAGHLTCWYMSEICSDHIISHQMCSEKISETLRWSRLLLFGICIPFQSMF